MWIFKRKIIKLEEETVREYYLGNQGKKIVGGYDPISFYMNFLKIKKLLLLKFYIMHLTNKQENKHAILVDFKNKMTLLECHL